MKALISAVCLGVGLAILASEAQAISRYNPTTMSCGEVKSVVRREGAVILRWTSPRGMPLYDRYVSDERFCRFNEETETAYVPSKDRKSCPVYECKPRSFDDDDFWWLRRRH
jgi:hypothetical protein